MLLKLTQCIINCFNLFATLSWVTAIVSYFQLNRTMSSIRNLVGIVNELRFRMHPVLQYVKDIYLNLISITATYATAQDESTTIQSQH